MGWRQVSGLPAADKQDPGEDGELVTIQLSLPEPGLRPDTCQERTWECGGEGGRLDVGNLSRAVGLIFPCLALSTASRYKIV